jgi:hypothetical protein
MRAWFRSIDWPAVVGSAFVLAFGLFVFVPLVSLPESTHEPQYRECECLDDYPRVAEPAPPSFIERTITEPLNAFTAALALFSLILSVVSIFQFYFVIRADDTARRAALASQTSANAALLHAKAVVAAEIGELAVVRLDLVEYPGSPTGADRVIPGGPIPEYSRIAVTVHNMGRTRVMISRTSLEWTVIRRTSADRNPDPPAEPVYTRIVGRNYFVQGNQTIPFKWGEGAIKLEAEEREAIATNQAWLWVYGYFRVQDLLEEETDIGFVAHWEAAHPSIVAPDTPTRGFIVEGPPAYVYKRKRPPQQSTA